MAEHRRQDRRGFFKTAGAAAAGLALAEALGGSRAHAEDGRGDFIRSARACSISRTPGTRTRRSPA